MHHSIHFLPRVLLLMMTCGCEADTLNLTDTGIHKIDLDGDSLMDTVVVGYVDNRNAHSYFTYNFFVRDRESGLNAVVISSEIVDRRATVINSGAGASCVTRSVWLVADTRGGHELVVANRPVISGYFTREKVSFYVHKLIETGSAGSGGRYQFVQYRRHETREKYCDANLAFEKEFNQGTSD